MTESTASKGTPSGGAADPQPHPNGATPAPAAAAADATAAAAADDRSCALSNSIS